MLHTQLCCSAVCWHSREATRRRSFINVVYALIHLSSFHALVGGCLDVWRILNCSMFLLCQLTLKPSEIVKRRAPVSWLNGYLTTWYNLAILVFYRSVTCFAKSPREPHFLFPTLLGQPFHCSIRITCTNINLVLGLALTSVFDIAVNE